MESKLQPPTVKSKRAVKSKSKTLSQAVTSPSVNGRPEIDVEQDIWVQLPPKSEFAVKMRLVFEGKAKPSVFADWVQGDE